MQQILSHFLERGRLAAPPLLLLLFLIGVSWVPLQSLAQNSVNSNAVLSGTVIDAESGEPLIGATVADTLLRKGTKTNINGKFQMQIEPGIRAIRISYFGYRTKVFQSVSLQSGETKHLEVALEQEAVRGDEVVVTGTLSTESQAAQLLERKKSATMNDVLGGEQIRRAPDPTSADAIKRLPGVTITGGRFVNIRGTSERYNNALLNGTQLTSTDPDKKAFSFDLLPAAFIDNAIVSKTFTPDLPANFAGGLVQINTISFPGAFAAKLSASGSYNSASTGKDFLSYAGSSTDWLGYDNGTRGLPSAVPNYSLLDPRVTDSIRTQIGRSFKNIWAPKSGSGAPTMSYAFSLGNSIPFEESEFGYIATLSYKSGADHANILRASYDPQKVLEFRRSGSKDVSTVSIGGMLNLSYKLSPTDQFSFKNLYDRSADDEVLQLSGVDSTNGAVEQRLTSFHYTERSLLSNQLTGSHSIALLNNLRADWHVSRSRTLRNEPDLRRYVYQKPEGFDRYFMAIGQSTNAANGGRFYSNMDETNWEGSLDLTLPVASAKIKFGGVLDARTRGFAARVFAFRQAGSNFNLLFLGPDSIFAPENIGPKGFQLDETTNPEDRYDASEHIGSVYAMIDAPFTIFGGDFRTIGGFRYEHSSQNLNTTHLGGGQTHYQRLYDDVLPALSMIYSINDRTNLRAAWSNTLARPEFREIAPFSFYDFELGSNIQGDTNINRVLIRNLDLRAEYYPTAGELLSVSLFHKRFGLSNELFGLLYPHFDGGAIEETNQGSNSVRSWANSRKPATSYGIEFELRKNLRFIDDVLSNFTVTGNYALIKSKVNVHDLSNGTKEERAMQGQAPYTLNLGILFTDPVNDFAVTALYNTFGKRIAEVSYYTDDLIEKPRDVIDASISKLFGGTYEVRYAVKDLLAQDRIFMSGNKIERRDSRGASHSLSLSVRF